MSVEKLEGLSTSETSNGKRGTFAPHRRRGLSLRLRSKPACGVVVERVINAVYIAP
jgi:hypothetical protein